MPPIPSFPNSFDSEHAEYERILAYFKKDQRTDPIVLDRLNIEQMFVLVEGVLPIEACLYYQVLPLFLEGSRLHLGMVAPDDKAASDYVRRIVSYLNYSLVTWDISSEALKASLSAYLRHADQFSVLSKQQPSAASRRATRLSRNQAPRQKKVDTDNHPTLVVDSPDAIEPSLEELIQTEQDKAKPDTSDPSTAPQSSPNQAASEQAAPEEAAPEQAAPEESAPEQVASDTVPQQAENQQPNPSQEQTGSSLCIDEAELDATQVISREDLAPELSVESDADQADQGLDPISSDALQADAGVVDIDADIDLDIEAEAAHITQPVIEISEQVPAITTQPEESNREELNAEELNAEELNAEELNAEESNSIALGAPNSAESADAALEGDYEANPFSNPLPNDGDLLLGDLPLSLNLEESFSLDRLGQVNKIDPKTLLQKLLARVLDQGIGRLYFEQRGQVGRILWSENGVLQSIVDNISPLQFRGVISELKGMTHLPLAPSSQPCQVDLERIYQDERILLRFRFIPTELGEEATLQVLRGAALRFYQQQQLSRIGRDALTIAQALQSKVVELRDRSRSAQGLSDRQARLLPKLTQMIHDIETQINELNLPAELSSDRPPDLLGDRPSDDPSP
ncbi:MAG: hypothetical protein WBA57_16410 [Elainellaceae cyanobacterium]